MHGDLLRSDYSVDVIVAAMNRSDTIERAVRSALAEPEVRKVIVVDDASTDNTFAEVNRIAAETGRVIASRRTSNRGPSAARNAAIELSCAPWLSILDADDFFLPGRIKKLLAITGMSDFIADDILQIEDVRIGKEDPRPTLGLGPDPRRLTFEAFVRGNVSKRGGFRRELGFLKPLIRRDFLHQKLLRYDETLRLGEDYALYAHAIALGARFVVMPACGYVSVVRKNSLSHVHTKHDLEQLRDFDSRLAKTTVLSDPERRALTAHYQSVDSRSQWLAVIEGFKSRSPAEFFAPFGRSATVSGFLLRQLLSEGFRRLTIGLKSLGP